MKVARSLLVALAAFGAVTATVAQPPGPVTPPACQMACHKGEYAKIQACGSDADCIAQVKASIASCMAACPPSSFTPNGAMVGDFTCSAKCVVKYGSCAVTCTAGDMTCYATCGATYAACSDACGPAAIEAEPMSEPEPEVKSMATPVSWGPDCDGPCYDKELQCYNACAGEQACQLKCVQTYSACCASQSKAPTMVADRPMKPTECVANCKAALNRCYTNVENWCSPTVWGASCKGQGRMQCMLTDTDCCVDCQRLPAAKVAAVAPAKKPTQVGFYSCQACTGDYSQCFNECPAGDAHCLNSCVNMFMGCMGQCEIDSVKASVASTVGATPVGDAKKQTLCRMACIGVDAAAKSACQHWMPGSTLCLENVADARQMCDIGCGLLEVSAVAPTASNNREVCEEHCTEGENEAFQACGQSLNCISGVQAQVNNCVASCAKLPETKLPVAASGCEAGCNSEYNQCVKSGSSPTTCFRQQNKCFDICHMRLASAESATMPALVAITAAKHELKGIPCAAACLVSQKTASLLCYAYPENLKKPCFDHLDDALSVCQFLCTFSPVMAEAPKQAIEAPKTEKAMVGSDCTSACWAADTACDAKCKATCKGSFNACFSSCSTQCWWAGSDCTKKCDSSPTLGAGVAVGATPVGDAKKQTLCRMACIGVDAAAKSACQHWMPGSTLCLENVADARQMCDIGCGLLEAPAMPPKLKGTACEASCNADYKGCMKLLGSSYSKCTRDQTACFKLCHQSVASPLRRVAAAAQSRVGDAECAKCAASLKDCFMGCNFDAQCSGRCFSNDWQCQLSC